MLTEERYSIILNYLAEKKVATIAELTALLDSSDFDDFNVSYYCSAPCKSSSQMIKCEKNLSEKGSIRFDRIRSLLQ